MSRRQRIVALLIVAGLVFFFVYSVGSQYRPSRDELRSSYTGAVEWLGERIGGAEPVLAEDFSAPCQAPEPGPAPGPAPGAGPAPTPAPVESPSALDRQRERVEQRREDRRVRRAEEGGRSLWDRIFRRGDRPEVVDGIRLLVDGSCTITIEPADPDVRELPLRSDQELVVVAPAPDGDAQVEAVVAPDEPTNVAIGPDGADILLRCSGSSECEVQIGAGDG